MANPCRFLHGGVRDADVFGSVLEAPQRAASWTIKVLRRR